jgi:hypothetical protein
VRALTRVTTFVAVMLGLAAAGAPPASAATGQGTPPAATGSPWPVPPTASPPGGLAPLGGTGQTQAVQMAQRASVQARKTGRPVVVAGMTSQTTTVTADPRGGMTLREYVLPVRVRRGGAWVAVSTTLIRTKDGLSPAAIPGDDVTFSAGGRGPLAVISAPHVRLAFDWPQALPAPEVSGPSATYRNVLPGVDLVVRATSGAGGGFSETLVIHSPAAARDAGLGRLGMRVNAAGTRVVPAADGGLVAEARPWGYIAASPSRVWDSTPGGGARPASVRAGLSGSGSTWWLTGGPGMFSSASTHFPVYIDASAGGYPVTGNEQAFDPTQSGCPGDANYDDSKDYPDTPVGYDDYDTQGLCTVASTDYSYYQVAVPGVLSDPGVHLDSATIQAFEAYSSSCADSAEVYLNWTGTIKRSTDWANKPGPVSGSVTASDDVGPDWINKTEYSCNETYVKSDGVLTAAPFNVLPDISAFQAQASTFTFRLTEGGNTTDADHKQFTDNPDLQVVYSQSPSVPAGLKATADNDGTGSVGCDTSYSGSSSPLPPPMGKSASDNGPYVWATYNDPDGDTVGSTVDYWQYADPSNSGSVSAGSGLHTGSTPVAAQLPASFTGKMANGTVVGWKAEATDGSYTSAWSPTCYFTIYPNDPDPPAMKALGWSQGADQPVGTALQIQITQSGTDSDPAREFVWGLDQPPPTTGTIPAAQICTTTSSTSSCTQITGGIATLTIVVPSPGPHNVWVYERDSAGNDSGMTNAAPEGATSTFNASGDTQVNYVKGASLTANFAKALSADGNSLISATSGKSCGATTGDGTGTNIDANDLSYAGWQSGKTVTVDGASFALPAFGTCASDNLLAANQEIGAGSAGAQGSALVFLATSTNAYADVPGLVSGAPDSGPLAQDATAPGVAGGTAVTGSGCSAAVALDESQAGCVPASGQVNYFPSTCTNQDTPYDLTVPDWESGPSDIAAVTVPQVVGTSGLTGQTVKLYAFAVPIDSSCTVESVQLPDVGTSVTATVAGSGSTAVTQALPGLHIFGIAIRNTTTASPEVTGVSSTPPAGQAWTSAFASPVEDAFGPAAGTTWGDQTIRIAASPNISAPATTGQVRIRLSNPGFLSADGTGPLQIGAATIAPASSGAKPSQSPSTLTFGGQDSVTIPEGGDVYSDPLPLPFSVSAGEDLLVSLWIENSSLPELPENSWASGSITWFAPGTVPNETAAGSAPFTGSGSSWAGATAVLTGIDVTTPAATLAGISSPGAPTVVVAGDNVIDGGTSQAISDAVNAPSQRLAGQLASQGLAQGYGVVDGGIESNQVLSDGTSSGGVSLLSRVDRDILTLPDVGTVIIDEGLEDLLVAGTGGTSDPGDSVDSLDEAYQALEAQLYAFGINVIIANLTPCAGYANSSVGDSCTTNSGSSVDASRQALNSLIASTNPVFCNANFDQAVSNGESPEALTAADNAGDDVNLTLDGADSGYGVLAPAAISNSTCALGANSNPLVVAP